MHPRKFVRDSVAFAASQYTARLALNLRGVVGMALLGPASYGAWNALMLVLDYGTLSHMGTQQGLDQVIPQRIVEGDAARLERTKRAGLLNMLFFGLLFGPVLAIAFRFTGQQIMAHWGVAGVSAVVLCVLLGHLLNYHGTLLRSHGDIAAVSQALMLQSVVGAAAGLALVPLWGAWGLLWGWLFGCIVGLVYARAQSHGYVPLVPARNRENRELLRVGFPIFLFLSSTTLLRSLDRLVVLRVLGTTQLGYYTLSIMAVTFLLYLPESVSYVLYPRLVMRYRESGARAEAMRDLVERPLLAVSLVVPAFTALAYLFADDVVAWVLPKYQPGVKALRILSFGAVGLAIASIPSFVLITLGRLRLLVTVALAITAIALGLDLIALRLGFGIAGVAAATLIAYMLYGTTLAWLALRPVLGPGRAPLGLLLRVVAPLALAIALAYVVEHLVPGLGKMGWMGFVRLLGTIALFLVAYGALAWPFARGIGLGQMVREFNWRFPFRGSGGENGA